MNNNFYNYGQQMPMGTTYPQSIPQPGFTNPLTQEQIKKLSNNGSGGFSLKVSQEEMERAICTHRDPRTQSWTTLKNDDGSVTCTICGATFNPDLIDDVKQVEEAVGLLQDILQTTKTLYLDIPEDVCKQFFQMLPFLAKVPQLYQIAIKNFEKYNRQNPNGAAPNMNYSNPFGMFNNMMGYQQMPMGMPQQPAYNNPVYNNGMNMNQGYPQQTDFVNQQQNMVNNGMPQGNPFQTPPNMNQVQQQLPDNNQQNQDANAQTTQAQPGQVQVSKQFNL